MFGLAEFCFLLLLSLLSSSFPCIGVSLFYPLFETESAWEVGGGEGGGGVNNSVFTLKILFLMPVK